MIHFRNDCRESGVDAARLKRDARKLLAALNEAGSTLSLWLVDDARMRAINREHRGKDAATDVLSFPLEPGPAPGPERLLGDVVISVPTAVRQAAEYDAPVQNEINRLLIHGILHVLGHDHEIAAERAAMQAEERRLAAILGMPWPYDTDA